MLSRYLKSLRALKDVNQTEMSEILGLSLVSYNKKENSKVPFTVEEVKLMSEFFNEPIENFFINEVVKMQTLDI